MYNDGFMIVRDLVHQWQNNNSSINESNRMKINGVDWMEELLEEKTNMIEFAL